jgi:predicted nucleic acid-binding protein
MSGNRAFIDSNIVVYAYSTTDFMKQQKAYHAMLINESVVSTQVLSEFCNVCVKKLHLPVPVIQHDVSDILATCEFFRTNEKTIQRALTIQGRYGFSYYDSQVVASALESECDYLFTEDLSDGQIIEGMTVTNIFL